MEERIARFVAGLRASGVRVSVAESEDAWQAVSHMGVANRDAFRLSLRATLVKDAADIEVFEELFPLYFGTGVPPLLNPQAELTPEQQAMLQDTLRSLAEELVADLQQLLEWLMSGQGPTQEQLQDLAEQAGLEYASSPRQVERYAHRMQRLLGWEHLQELLEMLWELLAERGMDPQTLEQLKAQVGENQEILQRQLEQFAGQQIGENIVEESQRPRQTVQDLMQRPLGSLGQTELDVLREQVRRLAARLRSRAALRQKRGKRGRLDAKATIRTNLRYGGVPFEVRFKQHRLKPKLVVLLDLSTSMRPVAEFFLRLLCELQDQVEKTRSFAFIDHLEDVTDDLTTLRTEDAIRKVLTRMPPGHYNTDLGFSLRQFEANHLDTVDSRTTVIVLGDGRNNYRDPGLDTFSNIGRRARRLVWLNPEYPAQWGTGDSDMPIYAPLCNELYQVRNLAQLAEAIDRMLTA